MDHDAAVAESPARTIRKLLADKAVLNTENIVGERLTVEKMPETIVEFSAILVVANLYHSIFNAKGIPEILTCRITLDFGNPAAEILSVKQLDPVSIGLLCLLAMAKENRQDQNNYCNGKSIFSHKGALFMNL